MKENTKNEIRKDMDDVIKTTREMRDYLLDESVSLEEKTSKLKVLKTALEGNKNIVSASVVKVNIENFSL